MCKVGDKFIIEIGEKYEAEGTNFTPEQDLEPEFLYQIKGFNSLVFDENGLDRLEKYESFNLFEEAKKQNNRRLKEEASNKEYSKGYEKGLSDAWECMKKILDMTTSEQREAFNILEFSADDILGKLSPQEAVEKLKVWEKKQEIKEGDYIISNNGTMAVVQRIDPWGGWGCLTKDGHTTITDEHKKYWKKTGRHIDLTDIFKELEDENAD